MVLGETERALSESVDSVRVCSFLHVPNSFERHLVEWPRVSCPNWLMRSVGGVYSGRPLQLCSESENCFPSWLRGYSGS